VLFSHGPNKAFQFSGKQVQCTWFM